MPLHAGTTKIVASVAQLDDAELLAATQALSRELSDLRKAPVVEDYAGPILMTGVAADQILHTLLVDELGGTPLPKSDRVGDRRSTDTALVGKLGKRILPLGVSVIDDPAPTKVGGVVVLPAAKFDDEGVATQRVSLVENGTLQRLVMSRTPRKGFEHSNGHGYASSGSPVRGAHRERVRDVDPRGDRCRAQAARDRGGEGRGATRTSSSSRSSTPEAPCRR